MQGLLFKSCRIFESPVTGAAGAACGQTLHANSKTMLKMAKWDTWSDIGPVENWPAMKPASMFASHIADLDSLLDCMQQRKAGQAVGKSKTAEFGSRMPPSLNKNQRSHGLCIRKSLRA